MSLKNVIFLIMLLKMCFIFGQEKEPIKRIIVDVGHGGKDPGAIGINGILEKDLVLAIGKEMAVLNKAIFGNKYDIYLTRYNDSFFSLSERITLAKSLKGEIFISLHGNSFYSDARGMEIFTMSSGINKMNNTRISIALGDEILREAIFNLNLENRGMKFANFKVLREMIKSCPALLIEVGFLNNPDEANYYSNSKGVRAIALAILSGVNNHFKSGL